MGLFDLLHGLEEYLKQVREGKEVFNFNIIENYVRNLRKIVDDEKEKDVKIKRVAHDLKNFLQTVLALKHIKNERFVESLGKMYGIKSEREFFDFLLKRLNYFEGALEVKEGEYNLAELVREVVGHLPKTVKVELSVEDIKQKIDKNAFESIIYNLAMNSIQNMERHNISRKEIKISLKDVGNAIMLVHEDTGTGLKGDPFKGRGFGLKSIRNYVENYGGKISWENRKEGARFIIVLPKKGGIRKKERGYLSWAILLRKKKSRGSKIIKYRRKK